MSTERLRAALGGDKTAMEDRKTIRHYLQDPRVQKGLSQVANKYLTAERMLRLVTNAIDRNPKLAECEPRSVLGAVMLSMAFGLEPNTPQQLAFLIPYARNVKIGGQWTKITECQFQIGARGFLLLAHRTERFARITARSIRKGDIFEHEEGSRTFLRYVKSLTGRGELIGAFSHAVYKDGTESAIVLPIDEIEKIRNRSETYRALIRNVAAATDERERARAEAALAETPWVMWIDDMAAKSALKKHAKEWPISGADPVAAAAAVDDTADKGTIDLSVLADPQHARSVAEGETEPPQIDSEPSPKAEAAWPEHSRPELVAANQNAGTEEQAEARAPEEQRAGDRPSQRQREAQRKAETQERGTP